MVLIGLGVVVWFVFYDVDCGFCKWSFDKLFVWDWWWCLCFVVI